MTDWLVDGVLGVLLIVLGVGSLHARTLYACVMLFVAFGLVLSLVWARLGAADLALAEAAIGAGLTGTLLFAALARASDAPEPGLAGRRRLLGALLLLPALALLLQTLLPMAAGRSPLPLLVHEQLANSGVAHPVTAVLLNYRAWDTLLELGVLLLALLGARQLGLEPVRTKRPWPLLKSWSRRLAPLLVLVGGYLLWRGSSAPGGAFQAGALLAGGLVLLRLAGLLPSLRWSWAPLRAVVLVGLGLFVLVAGCTAWLGAGWLSYPPGWAKPVILLIEAAATLSIAVSLSLLVIGEEEGRGP